MSSQQDLDKLPDGYDSPVPPGGHYCNDALGILRANNQFIGFSKMSNLNGDLSGQTFIGVTLDGVTEEAFICGDYDNVPTYFGGQINDWDPYSRYSRFDISAKEARELTKISGSSLITFSLGCAKAETNTVCGGTTTCHSDVTWIRITNGIGQVVFNGILYLGSGFATVDVCVPVTPTPTPSITPSNTPTPSMTTTQTQTPTNTATQTPTATPTSTKIYFSYIFSYHVNDLETACNNVVTTTYYSTCSTLTINCILLNSMNSNDYANAGWYSDGITAYYVSSASFPNQISTISSCITPTPTQTPTQTETPTPTPTGNSCILIGTFNRAADSATACAGGGINTLLYSSDGTINIGDTIYRTNNCSSTAIEAYYSDGTTWYQVLSNGGVADSGSCI
jgi:hypothetical protein